MRKGEREGDRGRGAGGTNNIFEHFGFTLGTISLGSASQYLGFFSIIIFLTQCMRLLHWSVNWKTPQTWLYAKSEMVLYRLQCFNLCSAERGLSAVIVGPIVSPGEQFVTITRVANLNQTGDDSEHRVSIIFP